jgi:hypothetical protein
MNSDNPECDCRIHQGDAGTESASFWHGVVPNSPLMLPVMAAYGVLLFIDSRAWHGSNYYSTPVGRL